MDYENEEYHDIEELLKGGEQYKPPTADELWKTLITRFFKEFVQYCHPKLYKEINFSKEVQFLEKELVNITGKQRKGIVDILAVVTLKDATEKGLLFHIEVQGKQFDNIEERMFRYYIRIWDSYELPITALVVITPGVAQHIPVPKSYKTSHFGTKNVYTYNVLDLRNVDFNKVIGSRNIIKLLTGVLARKKSGLKKSTMKIKIYRRILESGYTVRDIRLMLSFADHLMKLSAKQEEHFQQELQILEDEFKEKSMILTHIEERALKTGFAEGKIVTQIENIEKMLNKGCDWDFITEITDISEKQYLEYKKQLKK